MAYRWPQTRRGMRRHRWHGASAINENLQAASAASMA
jgi:hypothetical protein